MDSIGLHWKLKYFCELTVFNLNRNRNKLRYVCVYTLLPQLSPLRGPGTRHAPVSMSTHTAQVLVSKQWVDQKVCSGFSITSYGTFQPTQYVPLKEHGFLGERTEYKAQKDIFLSEHIQTYLPNSVQLCMVYHYKNEL